MVIIPPAAANVTPAAMMATVHRLTSEKGSLHSQVTLWGLLELCAATSGMHGSEAPAGERHRRPEQDREEVRALCHESAASPQIVRNSVDFSRYVPAASNCVLAGQPPYS